MEVFLGPGLSSWPCLGSCIVSSILSPKPILIVWLAASQLLEATQGTKVRNKH